MTVDTRLSPFGIPNPNTKVERKRTTTKNSIFELGDMDDEVSSFKGATQANYGKAYELKFSKESLEKYRDHYGHYPEFEE